MGYGLTYSQNHLAECARRWKITRIEIFGSWARGDARPDSDADLLITFSSEATWDLLDIVVLKEELETILGRRVDLIEDGCVTNPFLLKSIMSSREVLYAA